MAEVFVSRPTVKCYECGKKCRSNKKRMKCKACYSSNDSANKRFWSYVNKTNGCWLWTGKKVGIGYGSFTRRGKHKRSHRHSWELHNGPIPDGLFVCHRCDNPSCVNPSHLFLGTAKQNTQDMVVKNRVGRMHGTVNPQAKLTDEQVREIRSQYTGEYGSQILLAKKYHISKTTICGLLKRKLWSHI